MFEEYGEIIDVIPFVYCQDRGQKKYQDEGPGLYHLQGYQLGYGGQKKTSWQGALWKESGNSYFLFKKIQFAREKSDAISKIDGTFQIREKPENYFQIKFEEKFVKRPQQMKAKIEREKNVLKKIDNVKYTSKIRAPTHQTISSSARASTPASPNKCFETSSSDTPALRNFYLISATSVWPLRISLLSSTRTSSRREQLWLH